MQNITANAGANPYIRVLRRWWWLPILFALLSAGITYEGTKALMKPEYGASTTLDVQALSVSQVQSLPSDATTIASIMTSAKAEQFVGAHLSPPALQALHGSTCIADSTDRFINCDATSRYPTAAATAMQAMGTRFIKYYSGVTKAAYHGEIPTYTNRIRQLQSQIQSETNQQKALVASGQGNTAQYADLGSEKVTRLAQLGTFESQLATLRTSIQQVSGHLIIITPPSFTPNQVSPHPLRNAILGMIVGIGIAAALIVLLEYLDDTFRSTDEIAEASGLTLLGAVRKYEGSADEMGMVAAKMPRSAIAEAYRVARANIQFTNTMGNLKVMVVTSARDGEGKTTTANNLATTFALAGQRVLLVDADLRRPGLTKMMQLKGADGLSTVLIDPDASIVQATEVDGLSVVPSGPIPPNPAELLGSERMRAWVDDATQKYDLVVLDTPPVLSVADTRILATLADGVVVVLDPTITTRRMVKQARAAVENVGARILGVILNRDVMRGEGYYYNYYYYDKGGVEEPKGSRAGR